jgi:hypothetical protein
METVKHPMSDQATGTLLALSLILILAILAFILG